MDWEYSLRISYLQSNIAYYTGYNALSVGHPQTVTSLKNNNHIHEQGKKGAIFYEYAGDRAEISRWSKVKIFLGKLIYRVKERANQTEEKPVEDISVIYNYYYNYISELNGSQKFTVETSMGHAQKSK